MLVAIRTSDGARVLAEDAQKPNKPFICPYCCGPVVLKKGVQVLHHFAHAAESASLKEANLQRARLQGASHCGVGESWRHLEAKMSLYRALKAHDRVVRCEVEWPFGGNRPDVIARIATPRGSRVVAFEVQCTALPLSDLVARTEGYARQGVSVAWLGVLPPEGLADGAATRVRQWERWVHAAYFGRVYYWHEGATVLGYHFAPAYSLVPATDFGGGYYRLLKTIRCMERYPQPLHLVDDFHAEDNHGFEGGALVVPPCRLWKDRYPRWWSKPVDPHAY